MSLVKHFKMSSFEFPAFCYFLVCIFNCIHIRHVSSASSANSIPFEQKGTVRCYVIPSATPSPELKSVPVESSKSLSYLQSTKTTNGDASSSPSSSYTLPIILMGICATAVLLGVSYLLVNYALDKMRRQRRRRTSVLPLIAIARMPHAGSHTDANNNINIFERLRRHSTFMRSSGQENGRSSDPADRQERRGDLNNNIFIATEEPPPSYDHLFSKSNQNQTN